MCSQNALAAILTTALDVIDLPFESPALHILDNVDYLQAASGECVLALHRKSAAVHPVLYKPFSLQLPQPRRQHLLSDAGQTALQL